MFFNQEVAVRSFVSSCLFVQLLMCWFGLAVSVLWLSQPALISFCLGCLTAIAVEQFALRFMSGAALDVPHKILVRFKLGWVVKMLLTVGIFSVIFQLTFLDPLAYFLGFFLVKITYWPMLTMNFN